MKAEEIRKIIRNPSNWDQDSEGKNKYVRTAREGEVTHLRAIGIRNGTLRKLVKNYYKKHKAEDFSSVIRTVDQVFKNAEFIEEHIFVCYLLEMYKKKYTSEIFAIVDQWIDLVDHWMSSDHISINAMRHYPVERHLEEIQSWAYSQDIWRKRQSLTICLKHFHESEVRNTAKKNVETLVNDKSYYVRKALTWVVSELGKIEPNWVRAFLRENFDALTKTELRECSKHLNSKEELLEVYMTQKKNKS